MRILFMGTPDFALESLKALHEANFDIIGVVTKPDKAKGRGMKLVASPVKEYALENNFKIYQPEKVKHNIEFINTIKELNPDLICVVAYGKILPTTILNIPKLGCVNVHGSLLPKYRGAAPIQWAVLNGDKETGITTMFMDEGMDTGDMLLKEKVTIGENETTGELWDRLSKVGAKLLVKTLKELEEGKLQRIKQTGEFTVAPMLNKEMALIDWNSKSANEIHNLVRGLNPMMGAYSYVNNKKIKFWDVEENSEQELMKKFNNIEFDNVKPGTVLISNAKIGLYIKTINGIISVKEIQGENAKRMSIKSFLLGNNIKENSIFTNICLN